MSSDTMDGVDARMPTGTAPQVLDSMPKIDAVEQTMDAEALSQAASDAASETGFKLRSYQQEMLEASLQRNVIVAMDTGSGKTHIAIYRILAELERCDTSKLIWFMTPSVALSEQQHSAISQHLPAYSTKILLGSDGVDKWTDQKLWDAALTNVRILVGTPAVLADALTHGFVNISRFALLVFDEAHRCIGKAPMNVIMSQFYHPAKRCGDPVPHILGLSASPVMNDNPDGLQTIESNLDSQAITPKTFRPEMERFVHPPQISVIGYITAVQDIASAPPLHKALCEIVDSYDMKGDPRYQDLQNAPGEEACQRLEQLMLNPKSRSYKQLKALRQRSNALWEQIGALAADWYIRACIERFLKSLVTLDTLVLPDLTEKESKYLSSIFKSILDADGEACQTGLPVSKQLTVKARLLTMALDKHCSPSTQCIVFVEQRAVVHALAHVLRQQPEIAAKFSIGIFVGASGLRRKDSIADLIFSEQLQDLEDFRSGKKNLMIATDVLEEGIDVSACNLVICFDAPKNQVSFVQRRGRARQKDSQYIIFLDRNAPNSDPARWQRLEIDMKQAYMEEKREIATAEAEDEQDASSFRYRVDSTGALLTLDNAKAHLYHFCAASTLQASRYIDPRPVFDVSSGGGGTVYTANVQLPSFVHPDLRSARSSRSWRSWKTAVRDAAFQSYIALHKAGLLNDNLLPLIRDNRPGERQIHLDQASVVEIDERISPWKTLLEDPKCPWYRTQLNLTIGDQEAVSISMWLPSPIPMTLTFPLFWNEDITYTVNIRPDSLIGPSKNLEGVRSLRHFTNVLLQSVFGNVMVAGIEDDSPIMFSMPDGLGSISGGDFMNSLIPASSLLLKDEESCQPGIIRVNGQIGRKLIYVGVLPETSANESSAKPSIIVTSFPKRKDFLHRLPPRDSVNAAYTAKQTLPFADCTVDALPLKYSILAAFIPSIMHRIEVAFLAQHLQRTILQDVKVNDLSLICEAISSASAGEAQDYNRLEFLGDTVLKFCAVLQVVAQHPHWPEGYLTLEKFRLVTNNFLTRAALRVGLDKFILTKQFTGSKWRPTTRSEILESKSDGKREVSSKVLADVVESLIGAAYVDGGVKKGWKCISTILSGETWYAHPYAISLIVNDLGGNKHFNVELLERLVGHRFKNPSLLIEAITHITFPQTGNGFSYERLEFLGDAVLDMVIVPRLFDHPCGLKAWQLDKIKSSLVSSKFLGYVCMSYGIDEDRFDTVEQKGAQEVHKSQRRVHLHDFLRCDGRIVQFKQQTLLRFSKLRPAIDEALTNGKKYPWLEFIALKPLKVISDLIESVLGALYLDTAGDLERCAAFVEKIGLLKHMRRILDERVEIAFPKEQLGAISEQQTIDYALTKRETEDGVRLFDCIVKVGEIETAGAVGCSTAFEAEATAAWEAVKVLEERIERTGSARIDGPQVSKQKDGKDKAEKCVETDENSSC